MCTFIHFWLQWNARSLLKEKNLGDEEIEIVRYKRLTLNDNAHHSNHNRNIRLIYIVCSELIFGWQRSPSKMSMQRWCSSFSWRLLKWCIRILAKSLKKTSRIISCSFMSCWTVKFNLPFSFLFVLIHSYIVNESTCLNVLTEINLNNWVGILYLHMYT